MNKGKIVSFVPALNTGSSFGIFSDVSFYNSLILVLSILVIIVSLYYRKDFFSHPLLTLFFVCFISGVIGNGIDRIFFDAVRDIIALKGLFVFNLADLYLTLAGVCYFFYEIDQR